MGSSASSISPKRDALSTPIQFVKGVGPKIAALLLKKEIRTVGDALYYLPRSYEDRTKSTPIAELRPGEPQATIGVVESAAPVFYHRSRRRLFHVTIRDDTGSATLKWFHFSPAHFQSRFKRYQVLYVWGEPKFAGASVDFIHPEVELLGSLIVTEGKGARTFQTLKEFQAASAVESELQSVVPIYPETEGLYPKRFRKIQTEVVRTYAPQEMSAVPAEAERALALPSLSEALTAVHCPPQTADVAAMIRREDPFRKRLAFEELFLLSVALEVDRQTLKRELGIQFEKKTTLMNRARDLLPFELTGAQRRVIEEIIGDMERPQPMHRLVQGDVGCGKTVVAWIAAMMAVENGYQAALMVPTEILAEQHALKLRPWASALGVQLAVRVGSQRTLERTEIDERIRSGAVSFVIGTHALIQHSVEFHRLGLTIIDEQHRFGVEQRASLAKKGEQPDRLLMTATPIPRTLAMTLYGDLDISTIDERPKDRKPIKTRIVTGHNRSKMTEFIQAQIEKGGQAYFIYPLISESEEMPLKDATAEAERLAREEFPGRTVLLLHGRMSAADKENVMREFASGNAPVLVSTTVVEVGVDVPNANVMVVEHAERFGLAQLHQLRGRVGRGSRQSFCFLVPTHMGTDMIKHRLSVMERTDDGFEIAEADLKLRGPGDLWGRRQSGLPELRAAELPRDLPLLSEARALAVSILSEDPTLARHPELKAKMEAFWTARGVFSKTG